MSGYYVIVSGQADDDDGTIICSSIARSIMQKYKWGRPIGSFDLPMSSIAAIGAPVARNYAALSARQEASGRNYWIGLVYRNYPAAEGRGNALLSMPLGI